MGKSKKEKGNQKDTASRLRKERQQAYRAQREDEDEYGSSKDRRRRN